MQIVVDRAVEAGAICTGGSIRATCCCDGRRWAFRWRCSRLLAWLPSCGRGPPSDCSCCRFLWPSSCSSSTRFRRAAISIPSCPSLALFAACGVSVIATEDFAAAEPDLFLGVVTAAAAAPPCIKASNRPVLPHGPIRAPSHCARLQAIVPDGAAIAHPAVLRAARAHAGIARRALERNLGRAAAPPPKFALQLSAKPGRRRPTSSSISAAGLDADKVYVDYAELGGGEGLRALRQLGVAYVVIKRYNRSDPETLPFLAALAREGRLVATVSPYRPDTGRWRRAGARTFPAQHRCPDQFARSSGPGPRWRSGRLDGPRQ